MYFAFISTVILQRQGRVICFGSCKKLDMPTIIAIDCSLSMSKNLTSAENGSSVSKLQLARSLSSQVLEHILKSKLEQTAIMSFSSDVKVLCDFTRDLSELNSSLDGVRLSNCFAGRKVFSIAFTTACFTVEVCFVDQLSYNCQYTPGIKTSCNLNVCFFVSG